MTETWKTDRHRKSSQIVIFAAILLIIAMGLTIVFGMSGTRNIFSAFETVYRPPFVQAVGPIEAALQGLPASANAQPSASISVIEVTPTEVNLISGGLTTRTIKTTVHTFGQLNAAVNEEKWITETPPGVFVLSAGVIFGPGTSIHASAPAVTSIVMANHEGVFLGIDGAHVSLNGVTVESPSTSAGTPQHPTYRPFVVAENAATLNIATSTFKHIGWDWNQSYGVSYMSGSTGVIASSTFNQNFIGLYTDHITKLTVKDSTFSNNDLYGIDPHSESTGLLIDHNLATGNAAHGIILAKNVHDSVVSNNTSIGNHENGIMLDGSSTGNTVIGNTVTGNIGDGVTMSASSSNKIDGNTIRNNRVGISVFNHEGAPPTIVNNVVTDNLKASLGVTIDTATNTVSANSSSLTVPPPSWHLYLNVILWPLVALLFLSAFIVRIGERRKLPPRVAA